MAEEVQRVPKIMWNLIVAILATLGTGLGSTVGMIIYAVYDHESRITVIESTKFTAADGTAIVAGLRSEHAVAQAEIRADLKEIRTDKIAYQAEIRADLNQIRTDIGSLRREFDRAFTDVK